MKLYLPELGAFLLPFLTALALALALTPAVRWLAWKRDLVSRPKSDRWNERTIALLGGVAVWAASLATVSILNAWSSNLLAIALGGSLLFVAGLVDDVVHLRPNTKLSIEIVIACGILMMGLQLHWTSSPVLNALVTIVWVVGITNAFNLLDNMDGLCAGVAAITAIAFCAIVGRGAPDLFLYSAALAGAAAGFLRYNFNPATIFLGDSGSLFLGVTFALLALSPEPVAYRGVLATLAIPVLLLMLPIFDTTFVTISRKLSARAASQGGRDHTSHRLVALGFSERQASIVLYCLASAGAVVAIGLSRANAEATGFGFLLLVGLVLLGVQLARVGVYDGRDFMLLRDRAYTPLLIEVAYKRRILEVALDTCLISIAYYIAYALRFAEDFRLYYDLFVQSLPVVIACQLCGLFLAGVYTGVWRYITLTDLTTYVKGVLLGTVGAVLVLLYLYRFSGYSRTVFMIDAMVLGLLIVGSRLFFRWMGEQGARHRPAGDRAVIYGAGDAGALLLRELRNNPRHQVHAIGFLDDDPTKRRRRIMGLPVLGGLADVWKIIHSAEPDMVIVSTEKLPDSTMAQLTSVCSATGTRLRTMRVVMTEIDTGRTASRVPSTSGPDRLALSMGTTGHSRVDPS